jgi:hypothetical protein
MHKTNITNEVQTQIGGNNDLDRLIEIMRMVDLSSYHQLIVQPLVHKQT